MATPLTNAATVHLEVTGRLNTTLRAMFPDLALPPEATAPAAFNSVPVTLTPATVISQEVGTRTRIVAPRSAGSAPSNTSKLKKAQRQSELPSLALLPVPPSVAPTHTVQRPSGGLLPTGVGSASILPSPAAGAPLMASVGEEMRQRAKEWALATQRGRTDKQVEHWAKLIKSEQGLFQSFHVWADVALSQVRHDTKDITQPCKLRVSVACALFDRATTLLTPLLGPVLLELKNEIYGGIFSGETLNEGQNPDPTSPTVRGLAVAAKVLPFEIDAGPPSGAPYTLTPTWFDLYRDACLHTNRYHALVSRLRLTIEKTQTLLARAHSVAVCRVQYLVFNAWRGTVRRAGRQRRLLSQYHEKRSRKKVLQAWFNQWRLGVLNNRLDNSEMDREIRIQRTAQAFKDTINSLQSENRQLREDLRSLRERHRALQLEAEDAAMQLEVRTTELQMEARRLSGINDGLAGEIASLRAQLESWQHFSNELLQYIEGDSNAVARGRPDVFLQLDESLAEVVIEEPHVPGLLEFPHNTKGGRSPAVTTPSTPQPPDAISNDLNAPLGKDDAWAVHKPTFRRPRLHETLDPRERETRERRFCEKVVIAWVNCVLDKSSFALGRRITNFGTDLRDAVVLTILLHELSYEVCPLEALGEADPARRAANVISGAIQLGIGNILTVDAIIRGVGDVLFSFLSAVFWRFCNSHTERNFTRPSPHDPLELTSEPTHEPEVLVNPLSQNTKSGISSDAAQRHTSIAQSVAIAVSTLRRASVDQARRSVSGRSESDGQYRRLSLAASSVAAPPTVGVPPLSVLKSRFRMAATNNAEWQRVGKLVQEYAFKRVVRNFYLAPVEPDYVHEPDWGPLTNIPTTRLVESFRGQPDYAEYLPGHIEEALGRSQLLMQRHFIELRKIYKHYNGTGSTRGELRMTSGEFWRFCSDVEISGPNAKKLPGNALTKLDVDMVFLRVTVPAKGGSHSPTSPLSPAVRTSLAEDSGPHLNKKMSSAASTFARLSAAGVDNEEPGSPVSSGPVLAAHQWAEALLYLADKRYARTSATLDERLQLLLERHVLPFAYRSDVEGFAAEVLHSVPVQKVLRDHKRLLERMFLHYLCGSPGAPSQMLRAALSYHQWARLIKDSKLLGQGLTLHTTAVLYEMLAGFQPPAPQPGLPQQGPECRLHFAQFQHSLVALACWKQANPYLPVHQKLRWFLTKTIIPPHGVVSAS
eukprot:TRINITY_DN8671_c1_g1_i1.p1 TRINITY_DN8671_c1_g1~~TRINITY_DN8671_c1_g1_i1.p1  ORF type:complete len:1212 (-),score=125.24 TRINITY_DN8671_c1_g1_i1:9-3644(-)